MKNLKIRGITFYEIRKNKLKFFFFIRRNHQRAIESMQASLEAESKGKAEAIKLKKKLENDINELEVQLDHSNRTNSDLHKQVKRAQQQLDVK